MIVGIKGANGRASAGDSLVCITESDVLEEGIR